MLAESVAISGEAIFVILVVLVLATLLALAGIAVLVHLGAHLARRARCTRARPTDPCPASSWWHPALPVWAWIACSVGSGTVLVATADHPWPLFLPVAPLSGALAVLALDTAAGKGRRAAGGGDRRGPS